MSTETRELVEIVLRECASSSPEPWYPSEFSKSTGVKRESLDPILDELRLGGLIELTPWVSGKGQGYAITEDGVNVVRSPRRLDRMRRQGVPTQLDRPSASQGFSAPTTPWERGEAVRQSLMNPGTPRVTRTLLFVNIGIFLVGWAMAMQQGVGGGYLSGFGQDAVPIQLKLGMLSRPHVLFLDQWWRIVACFFVHIGALHIALNMYFLFIVGPMSEGMFGAGRFLILYFFAGLGASYSALVFSSAPMMAGASGALCGILAALPVWVMLNKKYLPPHLVSNWMRSIFVNIILIVGISLLPRVSAAGHFGGGIAGAIIAVPLVLTRFGRPTQRALGAVGVIGLVVGLGGLFYHLHASSKEMVAATTAKAAFYPVAEYAKGGKGEQLYDLNLKRRKLDKLTLEKARGEISKLLVPVRKYAELSTWTKYGRLTRQAATAWIDALEMLRQSLNPKSDWTKDDEKKLESLFFEAIEKHGAWVELDNAALNDADIQKRLGR